MANSILIVQQVGSRQSISAKKSDHRRFRKLLAPAFVVKHEQEAIIQAHVNALIDKLKMTIEREDSRDVATEDMPKWLKYTTLETIEDLLWGSSFGCLEKVRSTERRSAGCLA